MEEKLELLQEELASMKEIILNITSFYEAKANKMLRR